MDSIIDWSKLRPYNNDSKKSFEELCYQICHELYSKLGKLNPIDDSGGGDGVEFYLELPNGDIWGWQCKFVGRFSEGNRQEQIKKSLQKATDVHGEKLKKWVLCSKLSLTPNEKRWFEAIGSTTLNGRPVLSENCDPELVHWGDSLIINYLRTYPDIQRFFFSDKFLDINWFKAKFSLIEESNVIKSKYLDILHISGNADEEIAKVIGGKKLADLIREREQILNVSNYKKRYDAAVSEIKAFVTAEEFKEVAAYVSDFALAENHISILADGNELLGKARRCLENYLSEDLADVVEAAKKYLQEYRSLYGLYSEVKENKQISWQAEEDEKDEFRKSLIKECRNILLGPYFVMRTFDPYPYMFEMLQSMGMSEIHVAGGASKGKTHLAINVIKNQISAGKPALFLFGSSFTSQSPVREQLKQLLDIPADWSTTDFFGALEVCARVHNCKLVLAIDGLNESVYWQDIWHVGIESLANEINKNFPNLVFLTTYRASYEEVLFPKDYLSYPRGKYDAKVEVDGFTSYNVNEAIDKYFTHYEITLENYSNRLNHFNEPLYLKIFCEAKRGLTVAFHNEDMFEVLEEYLEKCNTNILGRLRKPERYNKRYTTAILNAISKKLWEYDQRTISMAEIVPDVFSQDELQAFEGEDLLLFRDWNNGEVVAFTYDLLNGYLIAKSLLKDVTDSAGIQKLISSEKFNTSLLQRQPANPLFDDILRSFSILAIKRFGLNSLTTEDATLKKYLLRALYDLNSEIIKKSVAEAQKLVAELFENPKHRGEIYNLFGQTELIIEHPLNFLFLSQLLNTLEISDRDISWTEHIRQNFSPNHSGKGLKGFIKHFTKANKKEGILTDRVHIAAHKVMWLLSSTNREMRDSATKAIYYYGRKFPEKFIELANYSLSINDPYIWERTLGALYGAVLAACNAFDNNFIDRCLPEIGRLLFEKIFKKGAPNATTHILARSYASMTIEVALRFHPKLLTEAEYIYVKGPFKIGGTREWGEFDYEPDLLADPIHMDFSNYTIGGIIPDGHSYSDPDTKKKARRQIYWRIFDLGWTSEKFKGIDSIIETENYRSRTDKAKTERYGKKYSWIAFYELAGYRDDLDQLENEWDDFRIIKPDIDLSFPPKRNSKSKKFVKQDYLGDRNMPLYDWYKEGGGVDVSDYLEFDNLNDRSGKWVCVDGYICQENKAINRERFIFIRALLIKNDLLEATISKLNNQDFGGRWLPEKCENNECFGGEMYLFDECTYSNFKNLKFKENAVTYKVKKGTPEYYRTLNNVTFEPEYPEEVEVTKIVKKYEVLLPVMEYAFSSESSANKLQRKTIISKELANYLNLRSNPDTFEMVAADESEASQTIKYYKDYNNSHTLVYLKKELLDKYLTDNNYSLVWGIWGERQLRFENTSLLRTAHKESGIENLPVFQSIERYKP